MTIQPNRIQHDARPFDGHTYLVRLDDGQEFTTVARRSYSGASIVFAVLGPAGMATQQHISELWPSLVAVERLTTTPAPGLNESRTALSRPDLERRP